MSSGILLQKVHQLKPVSVGVGWQKVNGKWKSSPSSDPKHDNKKANNTAKDIDDMIQKYSSRLENQKKKKKKKKQKSEVAEWVDTSFIKNYTDQDQLKDVLTAVEAAHPHIAEW